MAAKALMPSVVAATRNGIGPIDSGLLSPSSSAPTAKKRSAEDCASGSRPAFVPSSVDENISCIRGPLCCAKRA